MKIYITEQRLEYILVILLSNIFPSTSANLKDNYVSAMTNNHKIYSQLTKQMKPPINKTNLI